MITVTTEAIPAVLPFGLHTELPDETHVVQRIVADLDMPIRDLLSAFLWDDDCGLRFERTGQCPGAKLEFLWHHEDRIQVNIGVVREGKPT